MNTVEAEKTREETVIERAIRGLYELAGYTTLLAGRVGSLRIKLEGPTPNVDGSGREQPQPSCLLDEISDVTRALRETLDCMHGDLSRLEELI